MGFATSNRETCYTDLRDPTPYHAHIVRVQGGEDITPTPTGSQAYNLLILAYLNLVEFLQIDEDARVIDAGEAWIRRMPATADGEPRFEEPGNLERSRYVLR